MLPRACFPPCVHARYKIFNIFYSGRPCDHADCVWLTLSHTLCVRLAQSFSLAIHSLLLALFRSSGILIHFVCSFLISRRTFDPPRSLFLSHLLCSFLLALPRSVAVSHPLSRFHSYSLALFVLAPHCRSVGLLI